MKVYLKEWDINNPRQEAELADNYEAVHDRVSPPTWQNGSVLALSRSQTPLSPKCGASGETSYDTSKLNVAALGLGWARAILWGWCHQESMVGLMTMMGSRPKELCPGPARGPRQR